MEARLAAALSGRRPATMSSRAAAESRPEPEAVNGEAVVENGANVWPDEAAETAFLAGLSGPTEPAAPVVEAPETAAEDEEEEEKETPLPALDELVQRLSPETRELLDDLFRAKFVTVRRVPKQALKD